MGFFSKIVKGVKGVFKKIGKTVKSVFKKVGKFMNKIGVVGHIGLALIAPYAMPMLGSLATSMMGTTLGGVSGAIVKGAGQFLNAAVKVGTRVGQAFKSVTEAVTGTIKNVVGATLNKAGLGNVVKGISGWDVSSMNFKDAFAKSGELWSSAGDSFSQLFSKSTLDTSMNKFGLQQSIAEGMQKTGALELDPGKVSYDPVTGKTTIGGTQGVGIASETFVDPITFDGGIAQGVDLNITDSLGLGTPSKAYSVGNLPLNMDEAIFNVGGTEGTFQMPSLLRPTDSIEGALYDAAKDYKGFLPGEQSMQLAKQVSGSTVQTVAEATAWDKAKAKAAEAGLPTTFMGAAQYIAASDVEYDFPTARQDYVDYSALQTSPIYPSSSGLQYTRMLQPTPFDAPSLVDSIMNQDYSSIYTNSSGQGGFYFGFPSLVASMAQNAQEMLNEYE